MISKEKLMKMLIKGRFECYVRKDASYNPYVKSLLYDWEFKLPIEDFIFTDAYRGYNPYSGVECIYEKNNNLPIWTCDYVGYVKEDMGELAEVLYKFLKKARGNHLENCGENLFSSYSYEKQMDGLKYETFFQGDVSALLQIENFYYKKLLVAQQISSGRFRVTNSSK